MIDNVFFDSKILPIIRLGLYNETESDSKIELSDSELEELLNFSSEQSILPIAIKGIQRLNHKYIIKKFYADKHAKCIHQFIQQEEALKNICSVLDKHSIKYVLLKGADIRALYPEKELRTSCDIDILVHKDNLEEAVDIIELETDFSTNRTDYHDISMNNKYVHLELHFSIKFNSEKIDAYLDKSWDYSTPAHVGCRYIFEPEFQVFYTISHMCHHFLHGGLGVRPLFDLWFLRNKLDFSEKKIYDLFTECGITKFYEECCYLTEVWFNNKSHTSLSSMYEKALLYGGVFGDKELGYAIRQNNSHGIKYFLKRVFPPAYQVREFYNDNSGKNHSIVYLYFVRLISWFGKDRRKNLKKQVNGILSVKKDQMVFVDDLLKKLELQNYS